MPSKGQILNNPATGDVYEFLETAKDTNGQRVTIKMTLKSKGELVPNHYHALQEEHFEVISGKLTILLDGKTQVLKQGDKITLPKNKPHNHYNNDTETVVFKQSVSPALDFDYLLENIIGLTIDGKMPNGKAGLIQELVTLKYLDSKSYLANIPQGIQMFLMNVVGPIGRMFGYRAIYKKYSDIEK
ncbi:Cupin 2 conserved barrel domain protein (plasmid) [Emticicia oligotrophica DSM 17448]|uniref:Cupin 2 conserved barrel domain protein n=1 Tax=Emticicia oligotrophica (strain DSM 17448 / CIP 109782 / MTCC 6937 / GPTSA100-15) TaxID=929562 RepID=A0ABM5N8H4_EMTOG|nr:cupin domain-containing protein [Emticicia oligotrophica]AFK05721.1 Cupin 2 conserved barrel domain protein [Emticicia oligotrophica DSM 17448]